MGVGGHGHGDVEVLAEMHSTEFAHSPLLGERAANVYAWFLKSLHLPGDVAECGVSGGETSRELVRYLEANRIPKTLHMFDTFDGLPDVISDEERAMSTDAEMEVRRYACSAEVVAGRMGTLRQYKMHIGLFSETFVDFSQPLCFIHADADLYRSTVDIIRLAARCLVPDGHIVFDDYCNSDFAGVKLAIERYLNPRDYAVVLSAKTMQCFATKR